MNLILIVKCLYNRTIRISCLKILSRNINLFELIFKVSCLDIRHLVSFNKGFIKVIDPRFDVQNVVEKAETSLQHIVRINQIENEVGEARAEENGELLHFYSCSERVSLLQEDLEAKRE